VLVIGVRKSIDALAKLFPIIDIDPSSRLMLPDG